MYVLIGYVQLSYVVYQCLIMVISSIECGDCVVVVYCICNAISLYPLTRWFIVIWMFFLDVESIDPVVG